MTQDVADKRYRINRQIKTLESIREAIFFEYVTKEEMNVNDAIEIISHKIKSLELERESLLSIK